jgi:hypothetical protein
VPVSAAKNEYVNTSTFNTFNFGTVANTPFESWHGSGRSELGGYDDSRTTGISYSLMLTSLRRFE